LPEETAGVAALRGADPQLGAVIDAVGTAWLSDGSRRPADLPGDRFGMLVRGIIGQQVSTRAAQAMFGRLRDRFGGAVPTPAQILADEPEPLRVAAGLSHAKVRYLRSLAEHVETGQLQLDALDGLSDAEVARELTAVTGIGRWSADLFLMFVLERPDVIASGDLAIRRAVRVAYDLPQSPTIAEVDALAEKWRPYRTLAREFLWRSLRTAPG
jgi:DNA-3-methyladenine glycosylase II